MQKIKAKGQSVRKMEWKQADRRTEAIAVGNQKKLNPVLFL